jgi:hypothetical protein
VACCRRADGARPDDLYPDRDLPPLSSALAALDAEAVAVSWDDPGLDWAGFDRVLISSTWDSVDRPAEYLVWARAASAVTTLVNPYPTLAWGLDKVYLRVLAGAGVAVIPTEWVAPGQAWSAHDLPDGEVVVKPAISAGGRATARYDAGDRVRIGAHVAALQQAGQTVLVQPYLPSVDAEGECDLAYLGGRYSHAVQKRPSLQLGEGIIEGQPWTRMAWDGVTSPDPDQRAVAEQAWAAVVDAVGTVPVYGRVDLVRGPGGPCVLEVELVDPYLSLDLVPGAAPALARAALRP